MNKNTARLIVLAVIAMLILNGVLITMLWTNQSPTQKPQRPRISEINDFIISELKFDDETAAKFRLVSNDHHEKQVELQMKYRDIKRRLNRAMFDQDEEKINVLLNNLTAIVKTKELELFRFFNEIKKITNEEQQREFGRIFREATGPPDYERNPMDGETNRQPPPRH